MGPSKLDELRAAADKVRNGAWCKDAAHLDEDRFMRDALRAIADGDPQSQQIAALACELARDLNEFFETDQWRWSI